MVNTNPRKIDCYFCKNFNMIPEKKVQKWRTDGQKSNIISAPFFSFEARNSKK